MIACLNLAASVPFKPVYYKIPAPSMNEKRERLYGISKGKSAIVAALETDEDVAPEIVEPLYGFLCFLV